MLMTLTFRRMLLGTLLIITLAASIAAAASIPARIGGIYAPEYETPELTFRWWSVMNRAESVDLFWGLSALAFLSLMPLTAELLLRRNFGRSPSPEMFFLRLFLLTLPFQAARLLIPLSMSGSLGLSWAMAVSRFAWFARFLGISSLLSISVFAGDIPFRRSGYILGMSALASVGISVMLPMDITQPLGNMILRSSANTALALACLSLEILAVLAMAGNAASRNSAGHYILTAGLFGVAAGSDMLFFAARPLAVPGALLLVAGTWLFAREIRRIYQWI